MRDDCNFITVCAKMHVGVVDNLFNITSALSTTGLTTGNISELYTPFGKLVLLIMIQLGAIGYMTITSFSYCHREIIFPNTEQKF